MKLRTDRLRQPAFAMAVGTSLSRATGLMRTMALASALGVSALGDAYNTANTAPNMLFQLAAGGLLSSAVVPLLAREEDERRRSEVASVLMGVVVTVGVAASVLLAWAAPAVMEVLTAGARGRGGYQEFLDVGTSWLRLFAPQVLLYAVSVLSVGMLQARGRLGVAALAPVATNLLTIVAALAFIAEAGGVPPTPATVGSDAIRLLGWGTTAGVAAMAAIQLAAARRSTPGLRLRLAFRDPAVLDLRRLGTWVLLYVVVNQLGYAAVVSVASSVEGGVTAYQWAFTLMQLPYAVIAVSVHSAAYPRMAQAASSDGDLPAEIARPARLCLALLLPAAAGLAMLALPLAHAVVGRSGAGLVAAALVGFAASLVPFSLFQLLTRAFYARLDGRTPAIVNVAVNVVNVAIDLLVIGLVDHPGLRVAGLAGGHAASYVVGCLLLSRALRRTIGLRVAALLGGAARVLAATMMMTFALAVPAVILADAGSRVSAAVGSSLAAGAGAAVFFLAARALGVAGLAKFPPASGGPKPTSSEPVP